MARSARRTGRCAPGRRTGLGSRGASGDCPRPATDHLPLASAGRGPGCLGSGDLSPWPSGSAPGHLRSHRWVSGVFGPLTFARRCGEDPDRGRRFRQPGARCHQRPEEGRCPRWYQTPSLKPSRGNRPAGRRRGTDRRLPEQKRATGAGGRSSHERAIPSSATLRLEGKHQHAACQADEQANNEGVPRSVAKPREPREGVLTPAGNTLEHERQNSALPVTDTEPVQSRQTRHMCMDRGIRSTLVRPETGRFIKRARHPEIGT